MNNKDFILSAFLKKLQKKVVIPKRLLEQEGLEQREIISWVQSSHNLGYLIVNDKEKGPQGIILNASRLRSTKAPSCMCDFCLSVYPSYNMSQFSYNKTPDHIIGLYLCGGLDCEDRILSPETNNIHSMRETMSKEERIIRYHDNVLKFWKERVLGDFSR